MEIAKRGEIIAAELRLGQVFRIFDRKIKCKYYAFLCPSCYFLGLAGWWRSIKNVKNIFSFLDVSF